MNAMLSIHNSLIIVYKRMNTLNENMCVDKSNLKVI